MIYLECKPDQTLLTSLVHIPRKEIIHGCKGDICNWLRERSNSIGLVDEDPSSGQPRYIREARLENNLTEHDLKLLRGANNNRLVLLCPALEEWILKSAREADLDVREYGLPNDAVRLHRLINISLGKFEKLIEDLKDNSNRLKTLKRLLERER